MLPLLPIGIALATATVLVKRKIGRNAQKSKQTRLLNYIKSLEIPVEAVSNNNIEEARVWLLQGADVNIWHYNVNDWSMIHLAVSRDNPEMIELLVKFGADNNANRDGIPPLSVATHLTKLACFKKLLELGADVELSLSAIRYKGTDEMKRLAKEYSRK